MVTRARHVVITGASGGIGRALAVAYAEPGVVLGLIGRDGTRLEASAEHCRRLGARVVTGRLDVRDTLEIERWLNAFDDEYPIDLLIANAGAASTIASVNDWEDAARTELVMETNFYGAMNVVLPAQRWMRVRGSGHIVLISSIAALRGMAISPAYCASKAALKAYGDSVRPLLKRQGIQMSVVLPGFVKTPMSDAFPGDKRLMWSTERAARFIRRRLDRRSAEIAFPGPLVWGLKLLTLLPPLLADLILGGLSYGPGRRAD
ncbi:capsular biosynthesis protein [Burkholderia diffusa]|uniref:Capsular biosynthesis protein n=1 Tax=Burkholderia diffusa TaxID=488732 RepID=A0AAW3PHQ0_9BURK|nr:SDR family NAD(P)-dependent oxidoreductase [Burkholderia diffusa]KUZ15120.1 capsular biosynthesis protein [Burkholderia diffusa]KVC11747.1 capsular biosynthesis protein [Burkholderia diffusa]KWF34531.1 capsular biosynthesis protein [Burkholderia diffusa]KWF47752.1 capsular biosynthesis protein [Burkholderia diffusa]KWF52660.1 capsular biosynthesis protein [Burkholderia diffusa]